jgi:hypothetical protein
MPQRYDPTAGMNQSLRMWRYFAPRLLRIRDFSGGLNVREAPPELAANESPDLWNVTLDERGGVAKRLGYTKVNGTAFSGGLVQNLHYSGVLSDIVTQAGASLYLGTTNTARATFSTSARGGLTDFAGKVWAVHPVDGVFSSTDGITWTHVASSPPGTSIISWQNRLLTCGDPANPTRVSASAIGDGTDWSTAAGHGWNNELRENPNDGSALQCLAAASGIDIAGRPGLIACKRDSTYRLYDSSTGAYQTLDPNIGAASAKSVTTLFGKTIILSRQGIFWTDGVAPLQKASARIDPLFAPAALAESQLSLCAAGSFGDRCYFSLPRFGQTHNDLMLEYHPLEGWITTGSNAATCYATYANATQLLYTGSPTVSGQVYQQLSGGADDGAAIASYFQTHWFEPNEGFFTRFLSAKTLGRGSFDFYTRTDYSTGQGVHRSVTIPRGGFIWNDPSAVWNNPNTVWGPTSFIGYSAKMPKLGTGRSCSFRVEETSTLTATGPALLGTGTAPVVGAWGLAGIDLQYVQLGQN